MRERFVAQRQMQSFGTPLGVERAHMIEFGARQRRLRGVERAFLFEPSNGVARARGRQCEAALGVMFIRPGDCGMAASSAACAQERSSTGLSK